MPPTAPIRLMTALPWLRRGLGVTSGISATAGLRYVAIEMSTSARPMKNSARFSVRSASGRRNMNSSAPMVPPRMYGMRRPMAVRVLSLNLPNIGSMTSARMLSMAMTTPVSVSSTWNVYFRMRGMMLSYTCQNAQMDMNARPTNTVRR